MPQAPPSEEIRRAWRRHAGGYAIALAAAIACLAFRVLLDPYFHDDLVFLLFVPALLVSAAFGGLGPTVLAGAISVLLSLWMTGFKIGDTGGLVRAGVFIALTFAIGLIGSRLLRSNTAIRKFVAEARAREAHLQSILDTVPDAMIVIDERGLMQSFSSAAERQFGWTAAEVVGKNVSLLMPDPYRTAHDA
jgi:two-component system sensor kinase FixL